MEERMTDSNVKTYKLMWELIKYRPWLYLVNCILWVLVHVSPLIPGLIAKEFFDTLTGKGSLNIGLWGLLVLTAMTALARIVIIIGGAQTDILHRFTMSALIRRNIIESILNKPGAKSIPCSIGEAVNCLRDDAEQAEDSISWTLDVIGNFSFAIIAIIILLKINVKVTLLVFTPLVAVVGIAHMASEKVEKYRVAAREATGKVSGTIGEIFGAVQAIQVSCNEENVINHLIKLNTNRHKLMVKDSVLTQLLDSIFKNTVCIGTGLILLLVGQSMKNGSFTVGDFALFIYYLNFVADFTQFLGEFIAHYVQTGVAYSRMHNLLQGECEDILVKHNEIHLKGELKEPKYDLNIKEKALDTLQIKGLTYKYEDTGGGVENISFTVKRNSFTVITGRIGSGKTTLLKSLIGLLPMQRGKILWNDEVIKEPAEFFVPPISAYTAQVPNLFSDTVKNNILLGISEKEVELNKAIEDSILTQDIENLEAGLDTVIGPKGVKLSGGQVQRVAAARMLVRNAQFLIFDDISSALDVETEKKLWNGLFKEKDKTCLVVSNRRFALQAADNIIVLKDGKIEAQGNLEELLKKSKEMQDIWGMEKN